MKIKRYSKADEAMLFKLLVDEGEDWRSYHDSASRSKYIRALNNSITYVAYDDSMVCGYTRCREDDGFGIYVYDLLVRKSHRGRQIGKSLVTQGNSLSKLPFSENGSLDNERLDVQKMNTNDTDLSKTNKDFKDNKDWKNQNDLLISGIDKMLILYL